MQDTNVMGLSGTRILVAEDDPIGQALVLKVLENAGYRADVVGDGQAAVSALEDCDYDLVVMDCSMPVLDGIAATRAIRSGEGGRVDPSIPIIALTASNLAGDKERCLQAGMDDYVSKPVDSHQLLAAIGRCLRVEAPASVGEENQVPTLQPEVEDAFLDNLIDKFLADLPVVLADMEAALAVNDVEELQRLAHRLRGTSDLFQAGSLSGRAEALEQACKKDSGAPVKQLASELVLELRKLTAASGEV